MTGFDIIVLLLVGLGAINGFLRGFVQEVVTLGAWIFAVFAIRYLHTPLTDALMAYIGTESGAAVLAFALLLLVPYMVFKAGARWVGAKSRASVLGPIDRVIGLGFGTVKGMVISVLAFSVLVLGYDTVWGAGGRPDWITQSRTYPFVDASSRELLTLLAERRQEAADAEAQALKRKR